MDEKRKIYSVAELNRAARFTLENGIGEVWVEGEISRMTNQSSGHWYFTLKDEAAAVSCAMFKQNNTSTAFTPKDGIKVRVLGQASLYEPRGSYQLIIRKMEEAGKGSLQEQFEKLKAKLAAEGLFDADRKKPLPLLPRKIGVVTSPTGAAIRDIINVLTRRFPNIEILLAPVTVQGDGAARSIAAAIEFLNTYNEKVEQASRLPNPNVEQASRLPDPNVEQASRLPDPNVEQASRLPDPNVEQASRLPDPNVEQASRLPNQETNERDARSTMGLNERDARSTLWDARSTFFNPNMPLDIHERNMPHWQQEGTTYFVTFRLADSIPKKKLQQWQQERDLWLKNHQEPYSDIEKNEYHQLFSEKIQDWLDAGQGSCLLQHPDNAKIVADTLKHFDGERYTLREWVVMPNHVHALVSPHKEYPLDDILHSWKSFSAHEINKREKCTGQLWQHESYDHIVRSPEQLRHFENYIHNNPAKAGIKVEQASRLPNNEENERDARSTMGLNERDARSTLTDPNVEQASRLPNNEENERDARSTMGLNERDARSTLPIDLLIVGRGGGSIEDLWAFNEEVVARAIAASQIPVISAVGHEIDFTISDFVADVRAPTPSAAAELAVPVKTEMETQITRLAARLGSSLQNQVHILRERIPGFRQTMMHALIDHLRQRQQTVDEIGRTLAECLKQAVATQKQRLPNLQQIMTHRLESAVTERKQNLRRLEVQLRALNPLAVLNRGYSLTQTAEGKVLRDVAQIETGTTVRTRLARGIFISEVKQLRNSGMKE
jgi:exonuclease VII large subunit/REP element-mobilizing transposase RayT